MDNFSAKFQAQEHLNQESFSFSSFDFNSSLGISSDNDEDDDHESDEAYIEIALEQEQQQEQQTPPNSSTRIREDDHHGIDLELLRVSFSSPVCPFPGFSPSSANDSSACSSLITTSFPSSSANNGSQTETKGPTVLRINPKSNGGKMGFTTLNQLVDVLLSTLKLRRSSSSTAAVLLGNPNNCAHGGGRQHEKKGSWDLVWNRKAPSKVHGGAKKLLIKIRSINILSIVASFVKPKPRQVIVSSTTINRNTRTTSQEDAFTLRNHSMSSNSQRDINKHLEGTKSPKSGRRNRVNSGLLEINLDSITKMVEAVSKNIVGARGKTKKSKSCPGSIKSSPIHQERVVSENKIYARENSVQAAIAHCKQSFGQNN